ncbi:MAG TPA: hypothetical protein VKE98_23625, partial [Gemmataceae bacterium]|nr:hypothetical protein [Gemmataceae bacterium]
MTLLQWLKERLPRNRQGKRPRTRLQLEALEDRMTPSSSGQLVWTGPAGGLWSNSANWTDPVSHLHFAPSSTDQLLFGDGGTGANTSSTMDFTSLTVDRVIMDSTYNATLTIGSGHTLTTNYFQQYGTLSMTGSATVSAGTYIDIYGAVSAMSMAPFTSLLNASGSFFLFSTGSISALGPTGLAISSANFSDSGTIAAGSSSMAGSLTISGPFTQSAGTITVNGGSLLTFDSLKDPSAYPVFQSAVSMLGGATIATDTQLAISGGSLVVTGGP